MNDTSKIEPLLEQAKNLADNLKFTFDTPTGIPDNSIFLDPPRTGNSTSNGLATTGTLILEWQRLSDLTGDPSYGELAKKAESYLINPLNPELGEPFPGLLGTDISISNGSFLDSKGGWTGGTDSYYEYLIKMYLYDPETFADYKDKWVEAVDSSIEFLASHPTSRPDLTFLSYYRNNTETGIVYLSQHRESIFLLLFSSDVIFQGRGEFVVRRLCDHGCPWEHMHKAKTRGRRLAWIDRPYMRSLYFCVLTSLAQHTRSRGTHLRETFCA